MKSGKRVSILFSVCILDRFLTVTQIDNLDIFDKYLSGVITMAIKSYIRGFEAYPVNTEQMLSSTNFFLACASEWAFANDTVTLSLSNTKIEWEYFGSQVFLVVFYETL
jgi:hypothetical protein